MRLAIVVAHGFGGKHQRVLVSGIFLVDIQLWSPAWRGPASGVNVDPMLTIECHTEASVGHGRVDLAATIREYSRTKTGSLRVNNCPRQD